MELVYQVLSTPALMDFIWTRTPQRVINALQRVKIANLTPGCVLNVGILQFQIFLTGTTSLVSSLAQTSLISINPQTLAIFVIQFAQTAQVLNQQIVLCAIKLVWDNSCTMRKKSKSVLWSAELPTLKTQRH